MITFEKRILSSYFLPVLIALALAPVMSAQSHKTLHYKEYAFLELPDPPYGGYVTHATWNKTSNCISFDKTDEVGATVYLNHYFEGTELVTCNYTFTYLGTYDGRYHAANGAYTFSLSFASGSAKISEEIISLKVGKSKSLSCSIFTDSYGSPEAEWSSDNESIATVSSMGTVTAKSVGDTYIRVDPIVCPPLRCHVFVEPGIQPKSISIDPAQVVIQEGKTKSLKYKLSPEDSYSKVTWTSSDETIATVSSTGTVTGKKEGRTTVFAETENGKKASASVTVTSPPKSVSVEDFVVYVGYQLKLSAEVDPPVETSLSWKVKDTKVASVKYGVLTGQKVGTTEITVTTSNGVSATAKVDVQPVPKGMSRNEVLAKMSVLNGLLSRSVANLKGKK